MADEFIIHQSRLLVVEGVDEHNFFSALLRHMDISNIQITPIGGKTQFKNKLQLLVRTRNFETVERIGIVRDADANPKGAFDSVCSSLRSANLTIPSAPLTLSEGEPQTIVFVMPPNEIGTNRMLEDLCLESVRGEPVFACLEGYMACLRDNGVELRENVIAKAYLHAYLASRPEPDKRLGEAALSNYWNWEHPVFDSVKSFVQRIAK